MHDKWCTWLVVFFFFLMIRRPPISTQSRSSAASDVYKRQIHSVPITLSLPSLGPVQVTPNVSYREQWYQQKILRKWNTDKKRVDTLSLKEGFFAERDISFAVGATTRIFGMFTFSKKSKVQAIRHEIRPTIGSVSYTHLRAHEPVLELVCRLLL